MRRLLLACALALAACRTEPVDAVMGDVGGPDAGADLPVPDLALVDLSSPDLRLLDLAPPDLSHPPGDLGPSVPVQLTLGGSQTYARMSDGTARAWGSNQYGQLGDGSLVSTTRPQRVPGLSGVAQLATLFDHTCALADDRTVRCWGNNLSGGLGHAPAPGDLVVGNTPVGPKPTLVAGLGGVAEVGVGFEQSCARLIDGTVRCWGGNSQSQLDDGNLVDTPAPMVALGLAQVTALGIGVAHGCAIIGGIPHCWGPYEQFTLPSPSTVPGIDSVVQVAARSQSDGHVFLRGDGTVAVAGEPFGATRPDGGTTMTPTVPRLVPGLTGAAGVALGSGSVVLVLFSDGHVAQFGQDLALHAVAGLSDIVQIAAGAFHYCALRRDGVALCWGHNDTGQLGDGTTTNRATPAPVQF